MADWSTRHERLCRGDDSVGTDAIVPVKIDQRAGSSEMPRNSYGALRGTARQKPLDVRAGMDEATFARLLRGGPSGVKPIGRRDREQTDVAAVFGHQPDRLKRLGAIAPK